MFSEYSFVKLKSINKCLTQKEFILKLSLNFNQSGLPSINETDNIKIISKLWSNLHTHSNIYDSHKQHVSRFGFLPPILLLKR